jgi:hypothetical protein
MPKYCGFMIIFIPSATPVIPIPDKFVSVHHLRIVCIAWGIDSTIIKIIKTHSLWLISQYYACLIKPRGTFCTLEFRDDIVSYLYLMVHTTRLKVVSLLRRWDVCFEFRTVTRRMCGELAWIFLHTVWLSLLDITAPVVRSTTNAKHIQNR